MIKEIPWKSFESSIKLHQSIMGNFVVEEVNTFYDFVDWLKEYNTKLSDAVIVFHTDDDLNFY